MNTGDPRENTGPAAMGSGSAEAASRAPASRAHAVPAGDAPAAAPRRRSWGRVLRVGFLVIALGFGAWAVAGQWDAVAAAFGRLSWGALAMSLVAVVGALGCGMMVWRALLADLGSRLPLRPAGKIFFIGQLGKYIPGSIWPMVAQMEMGRDHGVPRSRSAAAFFLAFPVQLGSGLLIAAVTLLASTPRSIGPYAWALLLIPVTLVALEPRVINKVIAFGLRKLRREPLPVPLTRKGMLTALMWATIGWVMYGAHLAAVLSEFVAGFTLVHLAVFSVGAFALSWCLGIMTFVVPAGAGVREVAMVAVLMPVLGAAGGQGTAIAVALVSRMVIVMGDLICAVCGGWAARRTAGSAQGHAQQNAL
ncbi:lysylphosphatidylglycerol synthase transmembrane domain-containing protein [Sinosporangium siamense]|uniref:Membrane protein n=1 Tax=Sinosporangium siamense TaxID=1367973 RepID=A0A919RFM3_9ACTN|nr:lysylphosphatidylglycerol synthase transmembrane domain-containing protein [Sinosporangium siamense]GII91016.1 membrane protein [Sinosporangium siamense]